jgi:hypothetical protein
LSALRKQTLDALLCVCDSANEIEPKASIIEHNVTNLEDPDISSACEETFREIFAH